jgi:hypothetical protein
MSNEQKSNTDADCIQIPIEKMSKIFKCLQRIRDFEQCVLPREDSQSPMFKEYLHDEINDLTILLGYFYTNKLR